MNSAKAIDEGNSQRTLIHRVELVICQPNNVTTLILAFKRPFQWRYFSKILESLQQLCKNSERLTTILATSELFLNCLCEKLQKTLQWTKDKKKKDINVLLKDLLTFGTHLFQPHILDRHREQIHRILHGTLEEIVGLSSQLQLIAKQAVELQKLIKFNRS